MSLQIRWQDVESLQRFDNAIKALGSKKMRQAANRAVNRAGDMARTQVRQKLTGQTGLKRPTIVKAVKVSRSSPQTLVYRMSAHGGDVSLKYFGARETKAGVRAAPFGDRKIFASTFMRAGWWPKRVIKPSWNGQVFARAGAARFPIEKQKSGVIIPNEMVQGETRDAFRSTVARVLPQRLDHEINRLTKGVVS
ncbi:MAG: hypothetical protein H6887_00740 [Hoeflea sp.]|nr:hypothetical protein [Hoeflea sp.]